MLSAGLACASWHPLPTTFLIFVAFVPMLLVGEAIILANPKRIKLQFWLYTYNALLWWNVGTTWWIWNSTHEGAIAANVLNAALMTIPWMLYFWVRRRVGLWPAMGVLLVAWLLFEIVHLRWDLTWPWLTLGNVFAQQPNWVQWYSLTGALGGSAWVLWINFIVFIGFVSLGTYPLAKAFCWGVAAFLLMITLSYGMVPWVLPSASQTVEVVVVQPNIDPYTQKFEGTPQFIPFAAQLKRMIRLSREKIGPDTRFLLWPETALDAYMNEDELESERLLDTLQQFVNGYKDLNLIVGASTYKIYGSKESAPAGARFSTGVGYYDSYNTALHLRSGRALGDSIPYYHKSKLVPGVEGMPYPAVLGPLSALVIDLGGTSGGLGRQPEREVFTSASGVSVGPAICYESIYGDFMADFNRVGGMFIGIITNDAWWGNTNGHIQHFHMARLRAIESRRYIARSANTGISGYIDPLGKVLATLPYATAGVLSRKIGVSNEHTLYMLLGDYYTFAFVAFLCLLFFRKQPSA